MYYKAYNQESPYRSNLVWGKYFNTDLCPCCKSSAKANVHLLSCPSTVNLRDSPLLELETFMISIQKEPTMQQLLTTGMGSWMNDPNQGILPIAVLNIVEEESKECSWREPNFLNRSFIRRFNLKNSFDLEALEKVPQEESQGGMTYPGL